MTPLAIRPNAPSNAATASGGSILSSFWLSANRREAMTFPLLSTIRADNSMSAAGDRIHHDPEAPDIDQELEVGLSDIHRTQWRVRDVIVLEAFDQSGLEQLGNAVGPDSSVEAGIILCWRKQDSLRLECHNRGGLGDCQLPVDGLARRPEIVRRSQIVGNFLCLRAAASFEARSNAAETD